MGTSSTLDSADGITPSSVPISTGGSGGGGTQPAQGVPGSAYDQQGSLELTGDLFGQNIISKYIDIAEERDEDGLGQHVLRYLLLFGGLYKGRLPIFGLFFTPLPPCPLPIHFRVTPLKRMSNF